jgi:hypothetical protein
MGLDLYVSLFDIARYRERVEPTLCNYFATGQLGDVLLLLQDAKLVSKNSESCDIQASIDILNGTAFYGPALDHTPPFPDAKSSREDLDT